jgi:hypothetical protein
LKNFTSIFIFICLTLSVTAQRRVDFGIAVGASNYLGDIGGKEKTIINTTNIIKSRIEKNEIILGIIVYKKNNLPTCGTKGWILSKIIDSNNKIKIIFIDDSKKNIECVENINANNIKTYFVNKYKNPKYYLTKLLNNIDSIK